MNRSIYLARLLGVVLAIIGISVVLRAGHFVDVLKSFDGNPGLLYFTGLVTMSVGAAIVIGHNIWTFNWRVLITLCGWIALAKGATLLLAPGQMGALGNAVAGSPNALLVSGAADTVLGLVLAASGFLAKPQAPQKP